MPSQLATYKKLKNGIEGFFPDESAALWDALLEFQETKRIRGNMIEIGVWKGLSALLSSLHLDKNEQFVLVDLNDSGKATLYPVLGKRMRFIKKYSFQLEDSDLTGLRNGCRWLHIDGDHTASSVTTDLNACEPLLSQEGILVIDDFFSPRYPQLTEAVYAFLASNRYKLSLFLCGWNKAYFARPLFARVYRAMVRESLAEALHGRGIHAFQITKTAPLDECGAFGITDRFVDRDYYGMDDSPDELPL